MKTMTIWQRLHTTLAAVIVLLLIGVGVAWWVENTRSKTQLRSDQLVNASDLIRRDIVHLEDCLRWRSPADPKQEQKRRAEELKAHITSTVEFIRANYGEYKHVLVATKALDEYTTKLGNLFRSEEHTSELQSPY